MFLKDHILIFMFCFAKDVYEEVTRGQ